MSSPARGAHIKYLAEMSGNRLTIQREECVGWSPCGPRQNPLQALPLQALHSTPAITQRIKGAPREREVTLHT